MIFLKAFAGAVLALVGLWTLVYVPVVDALGALVVGWTLLLTGLAVFAPAVLDLIDGDR